MFINAKTLAPNTIIDADICIVGAGAAGITLARALIGSNFKVALFESGDLEFDPNTQRLYAGENVGFPCPALDVDRLRYFGGTTNHWSGGCHPFHEADFHDWPFQKRELEPYYERAHTICELGDYTYLAEDWQTSSEKPLSLGPSSKLLSALYQYSPPTRFGQTYRKELERANSVSVYLNSNLVEIQTNTTSTTVTGMNFATLDGLRFSARARHYVLATGAIENARMLLSGSKSAPNGLGNQHDLVGRYYMDHGVVRDYANIVFDTATAGSFYSLHKVRGHPMSGYLYAGPEISQKEALPPFCISLTPVGLPDLDLARSSLDAVYQNLKMGRLPPDYRHHIDNIYKAAKWRLEKLMLRLTGAPGHFSTLYIAGAAPDPESRVTLADSRDQFGLRQARLNWKLPSDFEEKMRRAHQILASELGRLGVGRVHLNAKPTVLNAHHQMGTTRMHRDPRQGVVDENCRIHGMNNLHVAGSSVFPSYSFDDPTMTIVALTLRLADRLKTLSA